MAKTKIYAIKKGLDPITKKEVCNLIVDTWIEAEKYIKGVPGAIYISSKSEEEANAFFNQTNSEKSGKKKKSNKVYVVFTGKNPETKEIENNLIFDDWDIVKTYVNGVHGALYKSFNSYEVFGALYDVKLFKTMFDTSESTPNINPIPNTLMCFVDGSYNEELNNYGAGVVCLYNEQIVFADGFLGKNQEAVKMRQIGGELLGAIQSCVYAKKNDYKNIVIFYDYQGVEKHATGQWKPENEFSKSYNQWMSDFIEKNPEMTIKFQHVKAHDGNLYNEIADYFAKITVGIQPEDFAIELVKKFNLR